MVEFNKTIASWCLGICFLCIPKLLHGAESQIGDCMALFFTKSGSTQCATAESVVSQAIDSGWAIRQIDGMKNHSLAKRWRVEHYPTIVLIRNGKELDRLIGPPALDLLCRRMLAASTPESLRVVPGRPTSPMPATVRGQSPSAIVPLASSLSTQPLPSDSFVSLASSSLPATANGRGHPRDSSPQPTLPSNPAEATVRIRVDEPHHEAIGTGTIIDTHQGEALVLTCGHLFRDATPNSKIIVETFIGGESRSYTATLIDYRADQADIGLISFRAEGPVAVARLVDYREQLQEGEAVYSWGCDHGATPSRRDSRITKLNRYLGEPNVEVYGAPVQGRSGGGLFNSRGELIGVCYAADGELNEGLYNAPSVVYQQLNRLGLQRLYTHVTSQNLAATAPTSPAHSLPTRRVTVLVEEEDGKNQRLEIANPTPEFLQAIRSQAITSR